MVRPPPKLEPGTTMLSGAIICPDQKLAQDLKTGARRHASDSDRAHGRTLSERPGSGAVSACGCPEVIFLSVQSRCEALDTAQAIVTQAPGTQIVAVDRACDPEALTETMQAGIREFMYSPFRRGTHATGRGTPGADSRTAASFNRIDGVAVRIPAVQSRSRLLHGGAEHQRGSVQYAKRKCCWRTSI